MTAASSRILALAALVSLFLLLTLVPSDLCFASGYMPGYNRAQPSFVRRRHCVLYHATALMGSSNSGDESETQDTADTVEGESSGSLPVPKRSVYELGAGQNKPLTHLRKNTTATSSEGQNLPETEFWGAGYIDDGARKPPSIRPNATGTMQKYDKSRASSSDSSNQDYDGSKSGQYKRYDLGVGKNSPVLLGGSKTRKLMHRDEEGKFLSRAVWSGGERSLTGMNREEEGAGSEEGGEGSDGKREKEGRHEVDAWDEIETDAIGSGLVGAHVDGPSSSFTEVTRPRKSEVSAEPLPNAEHHVDDKAVEAAASAYVKALLNGDDGIGKEEDVDILPTVKASPSPPIRFEDIDLSVPPSAFDPARNVDLVWDLMRYEAQVEADNEPILVSFLHSTILNHPTLESALAFHLANKLSAPAMIATQIMTLIKEALDASPTFRRSLRADILAVRDRDPACTCLPDVFLYFKGFHSLQSYRVAHHLWKTGRVVLAHYLQSQVSQTFQIDIHPNATLLDGIMLDHGTGIVIGETAHVGHNCSILHHVTLGGSGKKGVDRHPKIGDGVLLGAGCSALGNIRIGDGCQVGAGTLVIEDLPSHSVAVGVPSKIIGTFVDVTTQPARDMNQLGSKESDACIALTFESEGI